MFFKLKMSMLDFDCLKVTTMTVIAKLTGNVIIENIFPLLNITRLSLPPRTRINKKFKIPFCNVPGAILSAKFRDVTRGIVKSEKKKSFLNSITIDICTSEKNINAKLSGNKIHMCGPNSERLAYETAEHLIRHCLQIQEDLDYIHQNSERRDRAIQWLKENTVGQDFIVDIETQEIIELDTLDQLQKISSLPVEPGVVDEFFITNNGKIRQKEKQIRFESWNIGDFVTEENVICNKDKIPYVMLNSKNIKETAILGKNFFVKAEHEDSGNFKYRFLDIEGNPIIMVLSVDLKVMKVKSIDVPKQYPDQYPSDIDSRIINFYIRYVCDFAYHHVYCQFLDCVKTITEVIQQNSEEERRLEIDCVDMAMINYSYSVGMSIDRWALLNAINNRKNGFTARYCNSTDHSVTICLPYVLPEGGVRKKDKPPRHTFMVHRSGIVTQSGPNIDLMRGAYYRFMSTIMQIRHQIIQWNQPFNLKYIPKKSPETKHNSRVNNIPTEGCTITYLVPNRLPPIIQIVA